MIKSKKYDKNRMIVLKYYYYSPMGPNRLRKIHYTNVLICLLFFVLTPSSFSLNGLFPLSSDKTGPFMLFPLTNFTCKNCMPKSFPNFNVCLCNTGSVKVFFYCGNPLHCLSFGSTLINSIQQFL